MTGKEYRRIHAWPRLRLLQVQGQNRIAGLPGRLKGRPRTLLHLDLALRIAAEYALTGKLERARQSTAKVWSVSLSVAKLAWRNCKSSANYELEELIGGRVGADIKDVRRGELVDIVLTREMLLRDVIADLDEHKRGAP